MQIRTVSTQNNPYLHFYRANWVQHGENLGFYFLRENSI